MNILGTICRVMCSTIFAHFCGFRMNPYAPNILYTDHCRVYVAVYHTFYFTAYYTVYYTVSMLYSILCSILYSILYIYIYI